MNQENEPVHQLLDRPNQIDQNQKIFDSKLHQLLNGLLNQDECLILIIKLNYFMNIFFVLNCNKKEIIFINAYEIKIFWLHILHLFLPCIIITK